MIDCHNCVITEPRATKSLFDEELESLFRSQETPTVPCPPFPCHTQAVERCVKKPRQLSWARKQEMASVGPGSCQHMRQKAIIALPINIAVFKKTFSSESELKNEDNEN